MSNKEFAISRLKLLQNEIDHHMADYFESMQGLGDADLTKYGTQAINTLRDFSARPGKRVRGALVIVGYEMFGGNNKQVGLDLAIAMELVQNYLLILDDVMDRSDTRRGEPSVHRQYIDRLELDHQHKDAVHLGNMVAINIGLLAQHMAFGLVSNIDVSPELISKASSLFHQNIAATGLGQIEDLFNDALQNVTESSIETVQILKSSFYTFINPLQVGALVGGCSDDDLAVIRKFGIPAGIAFQLTDDIMGLYGDQDATGKSPLDDLNEGKITQQIRYALEHAAKKDAQMILSVLGSDHISPRQHEQVKQIVDDSGGHKYALDEAVAKAEEARAVVAESGWPEESKNFIDGLIEYIIERKN